MRNDRRKSYRFPTPEGSEDVGLRYDGVDYAGKVVNVSAEGFRLSLGVDSDASPNVTVGDVALLTTGNGRHQVRIANVDREVGTLQLGVMRLKDFHDAPVPARTRLECNDRATFSGRSGSSPSTSLLVQSLVLVAVFALILVVYSLVFRPGSQTAKTSPSQTRRAAFHRDTAFLASSPIQAPWKGPSYNGRRDKPSSPVVGERAVDAGRSNRSTTPFVDLILPLSRGSAAQADTKRPEVTAGLPSIANQGTAAPASSPTEENVGTSRAASFDSKSDGSAQVAAALKRASREKKHVLVEFGMDNRDPLHDLFTTNSEIAAALKDVVRVSLDFAANQKLASRLVQDGRPLNVPFLAILGQDGTVLKYQRVGEIKGGRKVDIEKLKAFLRQASPSK